ncbi:MAG: MerR family transcriptional regulator, partial [Actinobacteria bacterium]|nr:MerR family transcriptional regulator [Actinomycetota bacterium]
DIARLRRIAELATSGMNLEGIRHVMALEEEVIRLRAEVESLRHTIDSAVAEAERRSKREIVPLRQAVAIFGHKPSIFDK